MLFCTRFVWIYLTILVSQYGSKANLINQSPATVNLRFSISKFNQDLSSERYIFKLCIDKNEEKCFWTKNIDVELNEEPFKEISYKFFVNKMDTNLTVSIKMENDEKTIHFSRKRINLKKVSTKDSFEFHSITLENFIKLTVEHECESNYYPPNQCTRFCHPIHDQYTCDDFGNQICKSGLYYSAKDEKCLPNNCLKSNIQCHNNGFCVNKGSTFECQCLESYIGKFCEISNPCFPNPCKNNGKCFISQSKTSYFCSCTVGYSGKHCNLKSYKPCTCPANMRCNYSESGELFSCTTEPVENESEKNPIITKDLEYGDKNYQGSTKILKSDNKQQGWRNVSFTTIIVAAVGFVMIVISIAVSIYVFKRTKHYPPASKRNNEQNSPSTHYTHFSPKFVESTFKRSFSLEDNSFYVQSNRDALRNNPGLLTLNSSNGFSINSNSYQENPAISFTTYPQIYNDLCKQDPRTGYVVMNPTCTDTTNTDTMSSGSLPLPPALPPRPKTESPILSSLNTTSNDDNPQ